jgi:hypothetical protein
MRRRKRSRYEPEAFPGAEDWVPWSRLRFLIGFPDWEPFPPEPVEPEPSAPSWIPPGVPTWLSPPLELLPMLLVIAWIVQHLTPFQNLPENLLVAVAVDAMLCALVALRVGITRLSRHLLKTVGGTRI